MNVFELRDRLVRDYSDFTRSFLDQRPHYSFVR